MITRTTHNSLPVHPYLFSAAESYCHPCSSSNSMQKSLLLCFQPKNAYSLPLHGFPDITFDLFIPYQLPNNLFSVFFPVSLYTISQMISLAAPLTPTFKVLPSYLHLFKHFPLSKGYLVPLCIFKSNDPFLHQI